MPVEFTLFYFSQSLPPPPTFPTLILLLQFSAVQLLSCVRLCDTMDYQASLSLTISQSFLKLMSIEWISNTLPYLSLPLLMLFSLPEMPSILLPPIQENFSPCSVNTMLNILLQHFFMYPAFLTFLSPAGAKPITHLSLYSKCHICLENSKH